ncbi:MAG: trimethylamine methyltransferase family protein [Anaerolineae bacterium]|jgi:trimethylamine--corrinoid protein Co-methyltransferase
MANIRINDRTFSSAQFRRMSDEQCRRIHWASLEVMERTGVRLYEQEAIDLVERAGAHVSDGNLVRIPSGMVEKAFTTVPRRVVLCDRHGNRVMPIEGSGRSGSARSFFGPGSDCLNIIDHRTGERRKPVLQDIVEGITIADALPNIDFVMSLVLPVDVPQMVADRYQMEVMLNHTTKPIVFVTTEFSGCVDAVEMAEAVAGGPDALRLNPFVACYINVTTGLRHNQEALQKLLYLSGKGLPAFYIPVGLGGATAPVTVAGCQVIWTVGALVGLVISQLKREGAPYFMAGWGGSALDMRTMIQPYAGPDRRGIAQAMAHFYGLPMFSLGGCSDSKCLDGQAAIEMTLTLMSSALNGGHIVHDLGYLESGLCYSLVQLVICDEVLGWIEHSLREVDVSDVALAVDLIHEIGPDGQYLDSKHTLKHFRTRWYPALMDRQNHDNWLAQGSKTLEQRAAARVQDILDKHTPVPLPRDAAQAVRAIVRRAEETDGEA